MPTFAADPQALTALAHLLRSLGDELGSMADVDLTADFPSGDAAAATEDLMLNWRRERLSLARSLTELADATQTAATGYAIADQQATRALGGAGQLR